MTKEELKKRLEDEYFRKDGYSLENGLPNEAFCLGKSGVMWEVYYSERGLKSGLKQFESEHDACDYFYNLISQFGSKWHLIGFFSEEDQALYLMEKLSAVGVKYDVNQILYSGPKDWRYRVFVFGKDIDRVKELGIANEI